MEKNETNMSDLPSKQDEYCLPVSTSSSGDRRPELLGASENNSTFSVERGSLDQHRETFLQLQPSCAKVPAVDLTGSLGKDLEAENSKSPIFDKVEAISSNDANHSRQGQWSHLYQLVNGSKNKGFRGDPLSRGKDKHIIGDSENPKRGEAGGWNLSHWKTKLVNETRAPVDFVNGKNPHSETALLPQDARMKILSTSSFSQYFGNQNLKSKGISIGHPGHKSEFNDGSNVQSDRKLPPSVVGANSGMDATLVQYGIGGMPLDSNTDGICLREWLRPGQRPKNKFEWINLFRQIVELVNVAHSEGIVLQHLRPSYFTLISSKMLKYNGSSTKIVSDVPLSQSGCKRKFLEEDIHAFPTSTAKYQKLTKNTNSELRSSLSTLRSTSTFAALQDTNYDIRGSDKIKLNTTDREHHKAVIMKKLLLDNLQLEEKWYSCPGELEGNPPCRFSSNIYSLGVLLFELLCPFDSLEAHSAAMLDLQNRILPPFFLCESPKEAGFCLWLIHPEPASRPNIREVLLCDLFHGIEELHSNDEMGTIANGDDMVESELLLDFLVSLIRHKEDHVVKLTDDIRSIEVDLKGLEDKWLLASSTAAFKQDSKPQNVINPAARNRKIETRLSNYMCQLEKAYFSMRTKATGTTGSGRADRDLLKNREIVCQAQEKSPSVSMNQKPSELDFFYSGLCKFTCYSKFELRGTLRNSDLLNSTNVICSLSFDRDEEYIAVAGASKKIKIFEFSALVNDAIDIHYPVIEMGNKAKLSCISWNGYIKNYLASTDYDGIVQVWDASTAVALSQHVEHQKRAWSVDFSRVDPTKFASGSDDSAVKLWCTNEKMSTCTIRSPANVCCVQFSPYSSHLLAFGSADYKIYAYDLRHTRIPWCALAGHEKAVSYVKFMDSETLVSASTDNTLKLWDLNKTSLSAPSSDACRLTYSGHTNKKHFVGLSICDGYIACGSETNEVFTYYRSLPMPITSYQFRPMSHTMRHDPMEDQGLFVSSVCWRSRSNMVVAANSSGSIRLLQMV